MSDSPFAVDNYENEDVMLMTAAAVQAPGVEGEVLGLPVLLWGAPGVGKTSRLNKLAKSLDFKRLHKGKLVKGAITVLASVREASDFLGVPIPGGTLDVGGESVDVLKFAPPEWAIAAAVAAQGGDPSYAWDAHKEESKNASARAAVFFDEFATAPPSVQAALLRVIHERVVGDYQLPRTVAMLAAANPPWMSPGGKTLSPPSANRFIHLYWTPPSADQWANWLTGEDRKSLKDGEEVHPKLKVTTFYRILDQLKSKVAEWIRTDEGRPFLFKMPGLGEGEDEVTLISRYFAEHPEASSGYIPELERDVLFTDQFAWPSPRSLEIAVRARAAVMSLDGVAKNKRTKLANDITCATIGSEACGVLNAFLDVIATNTIPPQEFMEDAAVRNSFLKRTQADEDLRLQLEMVLNYYRDLPLEDLRSQAGALQASIKAFEDTYISIGSILSVTDGLSTWMQDEREGAPRVVRENGRDALMALRRMMAAVKGLAIAKRNEVA